VSDDLAPGRKWRPSGTQILAVLGGLVGLTAATVGLLYQFAPGVVPCVVGTRATITATIVPVRYADYYRDVLYPNKRKYYSGPEWWTKNTPTPAYREGQVGVIAGYTVQLDNVRDQKLTVAWSLLLIGVNEEVTPIDVSSSYRQVDTRDLTASLCSDQGGADIFIPVPQPNRRHRVLLELFRGGEMSGAAGESIGRPPKSIDRLALTQSEIFTLPPAR
jgi:hypothetical protein